MERYHGRSRRAKLFYGNLLIPLLKDQDQDVRSSAAQLLGHMGKSAKVAVPDLIPLLKDQDENVRFVAEEALKKLGYKP